MKSWLLFLEQGSTANALVATLQAKASSNKDVQEIAARTGFTVPGGTAPHLVDRAFEQIDVPKNDRSRSNYGSVTEVPKPGDKVYIGVYPGHDMRDVAWYVTGEIPDSKKIES